jgi:TetR/AcrR family transcriptional regulator, transcriptional repressor for nem operon
VNDPNTEARTQPKTRRGRDSRERIVAAAARLIGERGVGGTSVDDVLAEAGASKSQLYHYFAGKHELVQAVIARCGDEVLGGHMGHLETLDSLDGLERWFDSLVAFQERVGCVGGCPLGSLAAELADQDEGARAALAGSFRRWEAYLSAGFARMLERGELPAYADPERLAAATLASVEGGLLLARTHRSTQPLRAALDEILARLRQQPSGT